MKRLLILLFVFVSYNAVAECLIPADKNIRWIVPNKPGGGYDAWSRLLQPFLEERFGTLIKIENRAGAGGQIGAMAIRNAPANGTTMGIINAPGLLAANLVAETPAPDPGTDYTIIGRVATTHVVMFSGTDSGIKDINDLLRISNDRPILVGVHDAGSSIFIALPVAAALIGLNYELVTGYIGNTARTMAALRGEVDIVFHNFDSARRYVEAGELVPLLQITDPSSREMTPVSGKLLDTVPVLTGAQGLARQRAEYVGITKKDAETQAMALDSIFAAGRLIVAPRGLPDPMADCLGLSLADVLKDPALKAAAARIGLGIDYRSPQAVHADLSLASRELGRFRDEIADAIDRTRN